MDGPTQDTESCNPWTIVNLVSQHLAGQGPHPVFGSTGDPGAHAAQLLRALGIRPAAEGHSRLLVGNQEELARLRATMLGER